MESIILPEIVAIGAYNAQVVLKNKLISPSRKTTMFELELPLEAGGISYMDDTSHPIRENTVICAKPGQRRHTKLPFKCYYVHMIVNQGQIFDTLSSFPNYIELNDANEIKETFVSLCEYYNSGTSKEDIMIQSLLLKLIFMLDQRVTARHKSHRPSPGNQRAVERVIRYIEENLSGDLTLATLAAEAGFSPVYFHKLFRASTGKNLREFIEEHRIKKAVDLLTSTDKTLAQIAYDCGFSSQSHFSFAFKRKMKRTPREYAKDIQLKYEKMS